MLTFSFLFLLCVSIVYYAVLLFFMMCEALWIRDGCVKRYRNKC